MKFIALYDTYHNGYNLTRGGDMKGQGNPMHNPVLKERNIKARQGLKYSKESKLQMSQTRNKTGFYGVFKEHDDKCRQGFIYRYDISETPIRASDINKLEMKVKQKGHEWTIVNQELAEKTIIESEKCRLLREESHPTGFFRVIKHKDSSANLGYFYRYSYPKEDGSRGYIENRSIEKLKDRVLGAGLPWIEFDTPDNCINGRLTSLDEWA